MSAPGPLDPVAAWQLAHEILVRCRREALARHAHAMTRQRVQASVLRRTDDDDNAAATSDSTRDD